MRAICRPVALVALVIGLAATAAAPADVSPGQDHPSHPSAMADGDAGAGTANCPGFAFAPIAEVTESDLNATAAVNKSYTLLTQNSFTPGWYRVGFYISYARGAEGRIVAEVQWTSSGGDLREWNSGSWPISTQNALHRTMILYLSDTGPVDVTILSASPGLFMDLYGIGEVPGPVSAPSPSVAGCVLLSRVGPGYTGPTSLPVSSTRLASGWYKVTYSTEVDDLGTGTFKSQFSFVDSSGQVFDTTEKITLNLLGYPTVDAIIDVPTPQTVHFDITQLPTSGSVDVALTLEWLPGDPTPTNASARAGLSSTDSQSTTVVTVPTTGWYRIIGTVLLTQAGTGTVSWQVNFTNAFGVPAFLLYQSNSTPPMNVLESAAHVYVVYLSAGTNVAARVTSAGSGNVFDAAIYVQQLGPLYALTFTESGLEGGGWNVTVAGETLSAPAGSPIVFPFANGTYPFQVGQFNGNAASPSMGNATINGGSITVSITFSSRAAPLGPGDSGSSKALEYAIIGFGSLFGVVLGVAFTLRARRARRRHGAVDRLEENRGLVGESPYGPTGHADPAGPPDRLLRLSAGGSGRVLGTGESKLGGIPPSTEVGPGEDRGPCPPRGWSYIRWTQRSMTPHYKSRRRK